MASEIQSIAGTGATLYAVIRNTAAQLWYTVTPVFETYNAAHWTSYAIALLEQGASGYYVGSFPTGITTPGLYSIDIHMQAGGSPAVSDIHSASGTLFWNGVADSAGMVYLDFTQAIPTGPTGGTTGDVFLGMEAQSVGKWTIVGTTLTLYRHDGTTVVRTFTLDSATSPTSRS